MEKRVILASVFYLLLLGQSHAAENIRCQSNTNPNQGFDVAVADGKGTDASKIINNAFTCTASEKLLPLDAPIVPLEIVMNEVGIPFDQIEEQATALGIQIEGGVNSSGGGNSSW